MDAGKQKTPVRPGFLKTGVADECTATNDGHSVITDRRAGYSLRPERQILDAQMPGQKHTLFQYEKRIRPAGTELTVLQPGFGECNRIRKCRFRECV